MRRVRACMSVVVVVAALLLEPVPAARALTCGGFRWPVKTLSDPAARRVHYRPVKNTSVRHLRKLDPPRALMAATPRIRGVEFRTYRIHAELIGARRMEDHDVHLAIRGPRNRTRRMIVEFLDPRCPGARDSIRRAGMKRARNQILQACPRIGRGFVDLEGEVTIRGVGFWDKPAESSSHAPNGIELHPVLAFHGSCSSA